MNFIEQRWQLGPWNKQTEFQPPNEFLRFGSVQMERKFLFFFCQLNERDTFLKCRELRIIFCLDIQFNSKWNLIQSKLNDSIEFFFFPFPNVVTIYSISIKISAFQKKKDDFFWHRKKNVHQIQWKFWDFESNEKKAVIRSELHFIFSFFLYP